ncbi:uncharacterized protein SETTUDRAFT_161990 [Exserohilum turcica Et28A]|uniref:MARVEL domain-containing protein n=1 Tax=Exserohilum turcicum (strain 28A) TaxID=671987 RepID=R0KTW4_EXST2|nr:uncharacterized protein SETTUDRAFT_161990 [Exserohilum turcica Et28A]EOA91187.1 hypothetical protein SETTUDRAFT_161990 [Exserohilum turcica Et28A]
MSALAAIRSLRISQGIFTAANIGLASYLVHEEASLSNTVTVSLVAACISVVGALCAPSASSLGSSRPSKLYFAFAVDWVVSFSNLMALIFLALFVTKSSHCQEKLCTIAKINTVTTGFNFGNWIATTTYLGIQISKLKGDTASVPAMGKIRL